MCSLYLEMALLFHCSHMKVEKRHEVGQASKKNSPSKQATKSSIKPESSRIESKQQHSSKVDQLNGCAANLTHVMLRLNAGTC